MNAASRERASPEDRQIWAVVSTAACGGRPPGDSAGTAAWGMLWRETTSGRYLIRDARVVEQVRASDDRKLTANLVILDCALLHRLLAPDDPDYLDIASGLHRPLDQAQERAPGAGRGGGSCFRKRTSACWKPLFSRSCNCNICR